MAKESITPRGKKWEKQNTRWKYWSLFMCAGIAFLTIGRRVNEKKWNVTGIVYLILLWGTFIGAGCFDSIGTVLIEIWMVAYVVSIIHTYSVRNKYLIKLDVILAEREIKNEKERLRRETIIAEERLRQELEESLVRQKIHEEYREKKVEVEPISNVNNEKEITEKEKKTNQSNNVDKEGNLDDATENKESDTSNIVSGLLSLVVIAWIIWTIYDVYFAGYSEEEELAVLSCKQCITDNVFIIEPKEHQVDIEPVDEKNGMVVVRITVKDEELFDYSLYGEDDEIYFGYVPATKGYYYYFDEDEDGVKDKMDW